MQSLMPGYSIGRSSRRNAAGETPSTTVSPPTSPGSRGFHRSTRGINDSMEPAIDGPPSPERIRALSRQFRQASVAEKHTSTSSASSSWEQGLDDPHQLSRRSSQRSTSSGVPPRDRPESVVTFGKSIFSRKGKQRRDITDPNPSSNALFPPGMMAGDPMPPTRERGSVSAMFARRKSAKAADVEAAQRRLQISGPYNFQHLTHTQKDNLPNLERASRMDLVSEFSCIRAGQKPSHGSLKGINADDIDYQRLSAELLEIRDFEPELDQSQLEEPPLMPPDELSPRSSSRTKGYLPSIRPLSSLEESVMAGAMPPRVSSRASARMDSSTLFPPTDQGRLAPLPGPPRRQSEPHISYAATRAAQSESLDKPHAMLNPDEGSWPLAGPLSATAMTSVPELPEEDEIPLSPRQQPRSENPTNRKTSLRTSISVPLLHQMSLSQDPSAQQSPTQQSSSQQSPSQRTGSQTLTQRSPSNASDTLGEFGTLPIRRTRAGTGNHPMPPIPDYDNWEDDIDYCYEHAAEADCDFSWERHSLEMQHHHGHHPYEQPQPHHGDGIFHNIDYRIGSIASPSGNFSPRALSPGASDATASAPAPPARSPAGSRASNGTRSGTATPGVTSNFSLPQRAHNRTLSRSSSFTESKARGFSMSPTFFISADYNDSQHNLNSLGQQPSPLEQQHQRKPSIYEEDEQDGYDRDYDYDDDDDDDEDFLTHLPRNESSTGLSATATTDRKTALLHARSSASTDVSAYSDHSLASSRHKSNGSMNTALTRWTASSTCASLDGWQAMGPGEASASSTTQSQQAAGVPLIVNEEAQRSMGAGESDFYEPASPVSPTSMPRRPHERQGSDADLLEKVAASGTSPSTQNAAAAKDGQPKTRRRARTTSRSQNSPQLALFPHIPTPATMRRPSAF